MTGLHTDPYDNVMTVHAGRKSVLLFAPEQGPLLSYRPILDVYLAWNASVAAARVAGVTEPSAWRSPRSTVPLLDLATGRPWPGGVAGAGAEAGVGAEWEAERAVLRGLRATELQRRAAAAGVAAAAVDAALDAADPKAALAGLLLAPLLAAAAGWRVFEEHPLYRGAEGLECEVGPGEAVYIPKGWHHALLSEDSPGLCAHAAVNYWFETDQCLVPPG